MSVPRDTTTPRSRRSGVAPPPGGAPAALPSADNDADADIATPGGGAREWLEQRGLPNPSSLRSLPTIDQRLGFTKLEDWNFS